MRGKSTSQHPPRFARLLDREGEEARERGRERGREEERECVCV